MGGMKRRASQAGGSQAAALAKATDWDSVASWYDQLVGEHGSEYHRQVVLPGTMRLLGLKPQERFVDVACGQGVLCRLAHRQGARAVGVDAAAELIRAARRRGPGEIRYHIADARELSLLTAGEFDAAACVLAIQNIHPIGEVFRGAARALRRGGRLVLVLTHPCFRGARESHWGWDEQSRVQYRRVDRYLVPRKIPIVTHPGSAPDEYTWTFHKPLEAYVKALADARLLIDAIEEWPSHKISTSGPRAAAENLSRKEIPMFLAIRATASGRASSGVEAAETDPVLDSAPHVDPASAR